MPYITIKDPEGDITIEHNGDVTHGINYIQHNWSAKEEVREWFDNARISADHDTHFQIYIDGKDRNYLLTRFGPGKYFLKALS